MGERNYDMKITDFRVEKMRNILVRLYADQIGKEVESIKTCPENPVEKEDKKRKK